MYIRINKYKKTKKPLKLKKIMAKRIEVLTLKISENKEIFTIGVALVTVFSSIYFGLIAYGITPSEILKKLN